MQQNKTSVTGVIIFFLMLSSSFCFVLTQNGYAAENHIYVKNSYPYDTGDGSANRPYQSIQKAIDLAQDGDTIYVFEGTYNETLQISKRISIVGLDQRNTTIGILAGNPRYLIEISADFVTLEDLNITDTMGKIRVALIYTTANYLTIQGLHINNASTWGVYLDSSDDNTIGFSMIDHNKGIYASYSNNNVFSDNRFNATSEAAIRLVHSSNNILFNNSIKNCSFGVDAQYCNNVNISKNTIRNCSYDGVKFYSGDHNLVKNNTIKQNSQNGVLMGSFNSNILENTFDGNQVGILLEGSNNHVISNVIKDSILAGLSTTTTANNNFIYLNQFYRNTPNAQENGKNQWYNSSQYEMKGNYWDDYNEVDKDIDGIGDVPYFIGSGSYDLYTTGKFLQPPKKPLNPSPLDGKDEVGLSITLSVDVTDPDSKTLNVRFYNAKDDAMIDYISGVNSGSRASVSFTLPFETTLSWYATVSDGKLENRSDIWFFTTRQIPPTNEKPIANPGGPYSVKLGQSVIFDGSQSIDPDGQIIFYRWNFGDGSSEILDQGPRHTYADPGTYTVTLTVVDNSGRSAIANSTATVLGEIYVNALPIAVFNALSSVTVNQQVSFDASGSNDTDGAIVGYRWDFNGDGTFDTDWLITPVTTNTFSSVGSSIVTLEVKDDGNATGSFSTTIAVKAVEKKTPGFDIILVLLAVLVGLLIYNKQRK